MKHYSAKLTTIRDGKVFEFVPHPDMTAFELANIMLYLYSCNTVGVEYSNLDSDIEFLKYFKER